MHLVITPPVTGAGIARQAVVKSGSQALGWGSPTQITGWVADSSFPGVAVSTGLQIVGAGTGTVNISVTCMYMLGGGTISIRRNGVEIGSASQGGSGTVTPSVASVTVADGDIISLVVTATGSGGGTLTAATIDFTPA